MIGRLEARNNKDQKDYTRILSLLIVFALLLVTRLVYLYLVDPQHFPISTVKIAVNQRYISHQQVERILTNYWNSSFFSFKVTQLEKELSSLDWVKTAKVERIWPNTLKIMLVEKIPVAFWNQALLTGEGDLFDGGAVGAQLSLPHLQGPENKQQEVLQVYKKMSKILSEYSLNIASLLWRDNQAWELKLGSGVQLYLGKQALEARIIRFCKAYPAVFGDKPEQVVSVDLRYPRGMAVLWKTP